VSTNAIISHHARTAQIVASAIVALLVVLCGMTGAATAAGPTAGASGGGSDAASRSQSDVDPQAAAALARERGISVAEAHGRLSREKDQGEAGERLEALLSERTGGSYIDDDGNLVVTTLDAASDEVVSRNGARPQRVDDSKARLDAIVERLNRKAADGVGGIQRWSVDVPTNTVVVTVTESSFDAATAALLKVAEGFGDSVRVEYRPADQAPQPASENLRGGYEFQQPNGYFCSVGFNTRDSLNRNVVLTAGHCTTQTGYASRNGLYIGANKTYAFPGDDYGTFWNAYPTYWVPTGTVYRWDNTYARLAGKRDNPAIGASVCKSGRTTGWKCGTIKAKNVTVNYPQGTMYGLVEHTACVEGGDSGGSNVSSDYYALGVTSGASTYYDLCLQKYGYANVSWYQPIGEALAANKLTLVY
jgi:streptogrisin C